MEKTPPNHRLAMNNRQFVSLSGVIKVQSFDPKEILLETIQGVLSIKGDKLGIKHLDLKAGEVEIEGEVDALVYPRNSNARQNILAKIFR
jgi:sporulation protein YabP